MARFYPIGTAGGGAGSDDCTGTAAELLKGYTGILKGSDDEPVPGTLELTGNAQAAHVMNGETFYTNNAKIKHSGTMPNRGDYNGWGNSKGNDAGNQRMWVKLPHGYYNENANVFLSWADIRNMAGITPQRIKKNESILGIIGSFEGFVANPTDLYYKGANNAGIRGSAFARLDVTQISITQIVGSSVSPDTLLLQHNVMNAAPYSRLIFEGALNQSVSKATVKIGVQTNIGLLWAESVTTSSLAIDISQAGSLTGSIYAANLNTASYISRIRLV